MTIPGNLLSANAESMETDASAWSALINSATPTQASGGTLGSKCLSFKSTAAGDCQVGTAVMVPVTAGAEYWSCASVFPPAVGAQSRIEIRWFNALGLPVGTVAQGPIVSAPAATWHQVAVTGIAPATASQALVVIRVTATAATQNWFADRVFLGLTTPSPGQMLPWNAESVEIDTSAWSAAANASLSVGTSAFTWYQSLSIVATAAGNVTVQSAATPSVTPGTEYAGYVYVTPGTSGLTFRVQILWKDAGGSTLSTSSVSWTPATGGWTRCVVASTAPAGAATAMLVLSPVATASGQTWVCDRMVLAPTSALMSAGNLLPYNVADVEQDISGWAVTGGTPTQTTAQFLDGAYSLKMVATGGDMVASIVAPVAVTAGLGYQFAPCLYSASATPTYQTKIEWLDVTGAAIRTRWQTWRSVAGMWRQGSMGDLAPDGSVSVRLSVVIPAATTGDVWYMDRVEWKLGGLTAKAVATSAGGVSITVRGLTTGGPTWLWTLQRIVAGSAKQPVRGWSGDLVDQPITGDIAVATDYEGPLGTPAQWRVSVRDPGGSGTLSYLSDPVTLEAETTDVWLKDPGNPARSTRVTVATPMPTWATTARQGTSQVFGRALPVIISDVRSGKTGDLTVVTETDSDWQALSWVLETGNVLLLQWPPGWGEEDIYVSVGNVQRAPLVDYAEFHDRTWTLPLTQVDRPIGGVTGSADRTWATVAGEGSTWAEVMSGRSTWLDVYTGE